MPRGDNPNSRKALEKYRAKGQFNRESAVKAAEKSVETRRLYKSINEDLKERCTPERMAKMNERIISMAEHGNLRAYEMVRDGVGCKPKDSVEIKGTVNDPFEGLTTEELKKLINDE